MWTSVASNDYMCLTAHYVDLNWNLQKRVLIFHHVPPPHSGAILCPLLIEFIKEWGIEKKILTLTLVNATCNKGVVDHLKSHLSLMHSLVCDGKFFHIRYGNHILNLIAKAELKKADEAIEKPQNLPLALEVVIGKIQSSILPTNAEARLCARDWLCGQEGCDGLNNDEDEIMVDLQSYLARIDSH
ncbi:hypothetical protein CQW23_26010 [Capsicum baccatum]|uniref:Uncharacterized protein n=1 Tax=Capsicum baccatum TaxID=33114 RepID=A0A2G2VMK9_CAPBA|nr:hypothetical protein CQW23_26010 [Capsicum baccatum]